jgi:hypothetical protein
MTGFPKDAKKGNWVRLPYVPGEEFDLTWRRVKEIKPGRAYHRMQVEGVGWVDFPSQEPMFFETHPGWIKNYKRGEVK